MNQSFNIKRDIFQSVHFFSFVTKFAFHCNVKLWIKKKLFIPFSIRYFSTHCIVWVLSPILLASRNIVSVRGRLLFSMSNYCLNTAQSGFKLSIARLYHTDIPEILSGLLSHQHTAYPGGLYGEVPHTRAISLAV